MVKQSKGSPSDTQKSPARPSSPSRRGRKQNIEKSDVVKKIGKAEIVTRNKSPARNSPARTKSPSRTSPGRNKVPAKTKKDTSPVKKSPKRKSPSRSTVGDAKISRKVIIPATRFDTEFSGSDEEYTPIEKPRAAVRGRSRKLDLNDVVQASIDLTEGIDSINTYVGDVRRVTRNYLAQEERVVHLKHFDTVTKRLGEFSDDDDISTPLVKGDLKKQKIPIAESLTILFHILLAPTIIITLYVFCNKSHCSFKSLPQLSEFKSFSTFFDLRSLLGYCVLGISLAILSALPFGGKKISSLPSKQGKFIYVTNGFSCLLVVFTACIVLEYFQFRVWKFIVEHILHLVTSATIFGLAFSIYLYLRSFYVPLSALNPSECDKPALSGFFYGREVNPRLFHVLDLKMYVMRVACTSVLLADVAFLLKGLNLETKVGSAVMSLDWRAFTSNPTLLVLTTMHLIHCIDSMVFESRALSTYFVQYEGMGYRTVVGGLLSPFFAVAQTKYVAEHKVVLSSWELAVLFSIYLAGYIICRVSINQKDSFRRNPYSPASANMESIATLQGKKLLCSGMWGMVRQPNLLGNIVMYLPFIRFVFNAPPVIGSILLVLMPIERATSAQAICRSKYAAAWDKYCQKVKYILIPKVY